MAALGVLSWAVIVFAALGLLVLSGLAYLRNLNYQVGRSSLRVKLGRLTLRRIPFADIDRVDKPRRDLRWRETENWHNTLDGSRRLIVIHRRTGWFRRFVITPRHRYEFRRQLRAAVAESRGEVPEPILDEPGETDD